MGRTTWALVQVLAVVAALALLLTGCAGPGMPPVVERGEGGTRLREVVRSADVVFIGEVHNRPAHHRLQLDIIKSLHRDGVPLAIGLEMFDVESQGVLNLWVRGQLALFDFVDRYRQNWSIDWSAYDETLLYARNNGIPLVALNVPDDIIAKISHDGFESLQPKDMSRLPPGVNASMADSYRDFLRAAYAAHPMGVQAFAGFCDAQGVRNSTMALQIAAWLARHPGTTMVVITGVGHAMRRAVPAVLAGVAPLRSSVIIPLTNGALPSGVDAQDADFLVAD